MLVQFSEDRVELLEMGFFPCHDRHAVNRDQPVKTVTTGRYWILT